MADPDWYNTPEKRASVNAQRAEQERQRMEEARNAHQLRLLSYEQKLIAAGIDIDELIELIEARQNGSY
jgi:DNA-binding protein H-NS